MVSTPTPSGTNWPSLRNRRNCARTAACAAGVRRVSMSSVSRWRVNGAGSNGCGWVRDATLARHAAGGKRPLHDREERPAGRALEQPDDPLLARLGDGVDAATAARHRHQRRRRRQIPIPDVVVDGLVVPQPPAGRRVERQQRVGVEVVAEAVGAVEIGGGRSGRHEDDAARRVDRHAGPVVGAAAGLARAGRPGVGAGLTGRGDGPEGPAHRAGPHVDGADVAGRGRQAFVDAAADDQEIAVDRAGRRQPHRLQLRRPAEAVVEIDPPGAAERLDRLAGGGVEGVDEVIDGGEDARRATVAPVGHAAIRSAALQPGIERSSGRRRSRHRGRRSGGAASSCRACGRRRSGWPGARRPHRSRRSRRPSGASRWRG